MAISNHIQAYKAIQWAKKLNGTMRCLSYVPIFLFAIFLSGMSTPFAFAQPSHAQEYQVKSAFLFNFALFVEWPERAFQNKESPFVIGVLGKTPFGGSLEALKRKTVKERRILILDCETPEDALNCHILFISRSKGANLPDIVKKLKGRPILIVGDQDGFCQAGGMINLISVDNRIRFEVNDNAARGEGLKISSQLLRLAQKIVSLLYETKSTEMVN